MNRQSKGWLGEAAVLQKYERLGAEVWNLGPNEPAADLLILKPMQLVIEVKWRKVPPKVEDGCLTEPRFAPAYKRLMEARRAWCAKRAYGYYLYIVCPPESKGALLRSWCFEVRGVVASKVRNGLTLKVYELGSALLEAPEGGHMTGMQRLVSQTPSRAESRAVATEGGKPLPVAARPAIEDGGEE